MMPSIRMSSSSARFYAKEAKIAAAAPVNAPTIFIEDARSNM